ncbi:MAG: hypothetical protein U9Q81_03390 [Pseudomonadota bacterium]|nr:hypothetical protein [Pseudomonadota bacterium]
MNLAIDSNTPFKEIVKQLEVVLTLPEGIAPRGCDPCLSGLDRLVLESQILNKIR